MLNNQGGKCDNFKVNCDICSWLSFLGKTIDIVLPTLHAHHNYYHMLNAAFIISVLSPIKDIQPSSYLHNLLKRIMLGK
jgi:hypothetical protein